MNTQKEKQLEQLERQLKRAQETTVRTGKDEPKRRVIRLERAIKSLKGE